VQRPVPQQLPAGLRVLLAEDEPLIAMDGEAVLRAMGVQLVVLARSLSEGLSAIAASTFDAAFLDLRLGADNSLPLAQRLADTDVPFAFLTGYQGDAIPAAFKDRPVVAKPFTSDVLQQALLGMLAKP
jgi:CheY-like chemotaxis protein